MTARAETLDDVMMKYVGLNRKSPHLVAKLRLIQATDGLTVLSGESRQLDEGSITTYHRSLCYS